MAKRFRFFLLLSSLFLSSLFAPIGALGDEFRLIPSLGLKEEYNDNVFFTDQEKIDDFITTISRGLELVNRTEKLDANLLARISVLRYVHNSELNNVDQNYRGRLGYSPHPQWKLSGEAGYSRDSRADRDLEVTGLVTRAVIRHRQNYAAGLDHVFSEKTKAGLSYTYERDDYDDPEFVDIKAHNAGLAFTHDLGRYLPNTAGRMNLGYSLYEFGDSTINYYYATIGISWALSEKWNLLLDAGGSYTRSEFEAQKGSNSSPPSFLWLSRRRKRRKDGAGLVWPPSPTRGKRARRTWASATGPCRHREPWE